MTPCERPEEPHPCGRWKHGSIPVIGLIGGIGSGKSRVARLLADRGAAVIDADAVGHELLGDSRVRARIVERFGAGVLVEPAPGGDAAPTVDRRALGAVVFSDPTARRALEAIVHPEMHSRFRSTIGRVVQDGTSDFVVLDAAILLEAGWDDLCDRIVFVDAPRPERLQRVAHARGWSEPTFEARERAQWPCNEKRRRAHWVITNDAGPERLHDQVDRLVALLRASSRPEAASSPPQLEGQAHAPADPIPDRMILASPTAVGRMS